jgi:photosynthetic reaction center cytochrome c subunit
VWPAAARLEDWSNFVVNLNGWRRNSRISRDLILLALTAAGAIAIAQEGRAQTPAAQTLSPTEPAEHVFKNIKVLKGMPAGDLQGTMSFIASSLGVDCDYCHDQAFDSDQGTAKLRAREMILMVRQINEQTFHGEKVVNCFTCHQGGFKPVSMASVLALRAPRPAASAENPAAAAALPSMQQVLDKYVMALGGQEALDRIKTRVIKTAPLGRPSSDKSLDEVTQKAPGKVAILHQSGGYTRWSGSDGKRAWAMDSEKSYWGMLNESELQSVMRDSEMYAGSRLRSEYSNVRVTGTEVVGDRNAYVIAGTSPEGTREKFFFDAAGGLLLKRHIEEPTTFGWFPLDFSYEAYREVDGVKIPFVVRLASAGGAFGVRTSYMIIEVRQNVPIGDEKFEQSSTGVKQ